MFDGCYVGLFSVFLRFWRKEGECLYLLLSLEALEVLSFDILCGLPFETFNILSLEILPFLSLEMSSLYPCLDLTPTGDNF